MRFDVFLMVLLAAVCHAGWNFIARKASGNIVMIWWALLAGCVMMLPFTIHVLSSYGFRGEVSVSAISCMIATGVIHFIYFLCLSQAYEQGEISVVYPIARGSGVGLTVIFATLLMKENISIAGSIGIVFILFGIVSMGCPGYRIAKNKDSLKLALYVGGTIAAYSLVDKIGVSKVHPVLYIWIMFFIAALLLWPFVVYRCRGTLLKTAQQYKGYIILIGAGSIGTYLLILFAMTLDRVSYIVALREFAVAVGAILGIVFLKERINASKILAILMITTGLVCIKAG